MAILTMYLESRRPSTTSTKALVLVLVLVLLLLLTTHLKVDAHLEQDGTRRVVGGLVGDAG